MPSISHPLQRHIALLFGHAHLSLPTRARIRLAWLLWAVLLSGTVVQRQMARTLACIDPNGARASSHERRLRRALADRRLNWATVFAPLVRVLLRDLTGAVTVIIDESGHTDVVRVLTAALWYHGRAIPLAWIVWRGQTPHTTAYWDDCQRLLGRVARVLPISVAVTVVADRAFGCPAFLDPLTARGWNWVVRVQGQTRVQHADGCEQPIKTTVAQPGQHWWAAGQVFKKQGWRVATVVAYWRRGCTEPLLLVSSLPLAMHSVRQYRWRSAIEALFRDWKSYGLDWESSQVTLVAHHERVVLLLALATVVTLLAGCERMEHVLAAPPQRGMRRPWAARDSVFGLGRDRIRQRIWTQCPTPLPTRFAPPGTRTWSQRCWAHAAPTAAQSQVREGVVMHVR